MKTVNRDEFARMMREKASTFPVGGELDKKFNDWSKASDDLVNVGEHFSEYKRLKHLPLDVRQVVSDAMRELEVEQIV